MSTVASSSLASFPGGRDPHTPPLRNGDRLTQAEFLRRYQAMPEITKAELIEGRVYMSSPVSADAHGEPHAMIVTVLGVYCAGTPGVLVGDNSTIVLDLDNLPQPDAYLRLDPKYGGQARIGADGYLHGAPELIVEIAATSASYDLHEKLRVYLRNGVREYIVWRSFDRQIDYFGLVGSDYRLLPSHADGVHRSRIFPGLWLTGPALLAGDLASVVATQQQGLASGEHGEFVNRGLTPPQ